MLHRCLADCFLYRFFFKRLVILTMFGWSPLPYRTSQTLIEYFTLQSLKKLFYLFYVSYLFRFKKLWIIIDFMETNKKRIIRSCANQADIVTQFAKYFYFLSCAAESSLKLGKYFKCWRSSSTPSPLILACHETPPSGAADPPPWRQFGVSLGHSAHAVPSFSPKP